MNVLILTCGTGGGHNSAANAICQYFNEKGDCAKVIDFMTLAGPHTAHLVNQTYIGLTQVSPHLFGLFYRIADKISSNKRKSPVYYANSFMQNPLLSYLNKNKTDLLIFPHLYPAETITYLKEKGEVLPPTIFVATDYTCIPFIEETTCNAYVIPDQELIPEYISRGFKKEQLYPFGIPVNQSFYGVSHRNRSRQVLSLTDDEPVFLVLTGSMGFGPTRLFIKELASACTNNETIFVVCGTNHSLYQTLSTQYRNNPRIHIIGYTKHIREYVDAADVIFTKPGGLSSTELLTRHVPFVITSPIPGCETSNRTYFVTRNLALSGNTIKEQIAAGIRLMNDKKLQQSIIHNQKKASHPDTLEQIYRLAHNRVGG